MKQVPRPENEAERIQALERYRILDTGPEPAFDEIARLASFICHAPISIVSFADSDRHWHKSRVGLDCIEISRDQALCAYAILSPRLFQISDTRADDRFREHPMVQSEPHIRFYAGAPLITDDGHILGALCVMDRRPKRLDTRQVEALEALARKVVVLLELRRQRMELDDTHLALQAMHREASVFRHAVQAASVGMVIADASHAAMPLIAVNPAFLAMTGYQECEVIGRNCRFLQGPETDRETVRQIGHALRSGRRAQARVLNYRKDGSMFWNDLIIDPVRDQCGTLTHFIGVQADVSESVQHQALIFDQQRTLAYASKMSSLGEMAAGIAHEINNPLAVLHASAGQLSQLFMENELSAETLDRIVGRMQKTTMRIARIIKGLRAFAREGEGEPFGEFALEDMIQETLELCQERFSNHETRLTVENLIPDVHVNGSSVQLSQILLNLLNNAFDAVQDCEDKWVRVEVCEVGDGTGETCEIEVAVLDSGPGVPPEDFNKILKPFFTTKGAGKGVGLGLSISKGLVERHGGRLFMDTTSAQTRFVVRLPASLRVDRRSSSAA